ncbi:MAG: FHA domain-containing protein [Kiritimatiellia bacterium]|nr:FHA domain-containing protein [Lentisphaerota bacterium]
MLLRYVLPDGQHREYKLGDKPVTIGRSSEVDISIPDRMASRMHCGISFLNGAYFLRDFKSRNGTLVNEQAVEVARLRPGDRIRAGDTVLVFEGHERKGQDTALMEMQDAMAKGKGYNTILHEIIDEEGKG